MQRIHNVSHPANAVKLMVFGFFLKVGYYGLFALLYFVLVKNNGFDNSQYLEIYSQKSLVFILTYVFSGLLATFWLTHKKWLLTGSSLLIIGILCLLSHQHSVLYAGLLLIGLGFPMASVNQMSAFINAYNDHKNGLYSGYMFLYLIVNIAGFFGPLTIGWLATKHIDWAIYLLAIVFVISLILAYSIHQLPKAYELKLQLSNNKRILNTGISFVLLMLLFTVTSVLYYNLSGFEHQFESIFSQPILGFNNLSVFIDGYYFWIIIILGIPLSIFLLFYKPNYFKTMMLGLLFLFLSVVILQLMPETVQKMDLIWIVLSFLLLGLAEVIIAPMSYVNMGIHINPKYLTLVFGIFMALAYSTNLIASFSKKYMSLSEWAALILFTALGIGYIAFRNKTDNIDL